MSLLKRINRSPFAPIKEDEGEPAVPGMLEEMSSAWSVWEELKKNPVLKTLAENSRLSAEARYPADGWAVIGTNGVIYANPLCIAPAAQWEFVLAHLLVHLGLRHRPGAKPAMAAAYELTANALVYQIGVGSAPEGFPVNEELTDARALCAEWRRAGKQPDPSWRSAAGTAVQDVIDTGAHAPPADAWAMMLTRGLLENLERASGVSGGVAWATIGASLARQALLWFKDNFPLLSALSAHFDIIEDRETVRAMHIETAAVVAERMEILVNPDFPLDALETRFVMAHEMLHVGLLHHRRRGDRDPFIWNIACDYVINAWLLEMGVGQMPKGALYNPAFAGMSANVIYDLLVNDPAFVRQLITFRGVGLVDLLPQGVRGGGRRVNGQWAANLADSLMKQGIKAHIDGKRGLLPAEMLEMVTPHAAPAPPWQMALSRWFNVHFDENTLPARSYARQSRRQQATPDIPRPRYNVPLLPDQSHVFGVLLDSSGSMSNELLGKCLGAIVGLANKYRIKQVRLVFCDTQAYDEGFVPIKRLMEPMPIKGRGGTLLQSGVERFSAIKDFPKDAPILIITDAACDVMTVKRDHAFLIPKGRTLPFKASGPIFYLE